MSAAAQLSDASVEAAPAPARRQPGGWWALPLLIVLAAALRLSTLNLQSFWYDEAFTPVHVLHASLIATLHSVAHTENTPPAWYVIAWVQSRLFGTGEVALRAPSAILGIATVAVAWGIGRELAGRAGAIACALLVAVNPLFVWYSQEARAYSLFVFAASLALFFFLRLERSAARGHPSRRALAGFVLSAVLALASHYFAMFLLIPMVVWLLWRTPTRRAGLLAGGVLALAGAALVPLIIAQGGHGTQWIGRWPLGERLQTIPEYYLTGYSGAPLGHGVELLVALPILAALVLAAWPRSVVEHGPRAGEEAGARGEKATAAHGAPGEDRDTWPARPALLTLAVCCCGVLIPIALIAFGADYLAPRNLVAAMVPLTALIAVVCVWPAPAGSRQSRPGLVSGSRTPLAGVLALLAIALAFLAITLDVNLSPRLQRGDWRGLAGALTHAQAPARRAITTVELGSAPLEYYMPSLRELPRGAVARVREIDEIGYAPLRVSAARPPAPGFRLLSRVDVDGLIAYRFVSPVARVVSAEALRRRVITPDTPPFVFLAGQSSNHLRSGG